MTAQKLALLLDCIAGPPRQSGQEQVIQLDDVVEQRLAGLDQITGDKSVAFGRRETPQIAGIIAPAELTGLAHDTRVEVVEPGSCAEQVLDQAPTADVAFDDAGIGRTRIVFEPEQARSGVSGRHFEQQIDRFTQFLRQAGGDSLEQFARGLRRHGIDDPFECAGRRQDDAPAAQFVLRLSQKFGGAAALAGALPQPLPQPSGRALVEGRKAEITANALRLLALGGFAPWRAEKENRRQLELAREVIDDPEWRLPV